ncbi:MAG: hypothetical protein K0S18_119 [Anaerocolumna sp.]|jgi:hypothetical protein|nr:hypothetical protein [Anaerocolumna sp.]
MNHLVWKDGDKMGIVIICFKRYESKYETNDTEIYEWIEYSSLDEFEKHYPNCKVKFVFTKEDNLIR